MLHVYISLSNELSHTSICFYSKSDFYRSVDFYRLYIFQEKKILNSASCAESDRNCVLFCKRTHRIVYQIISGHKLLLTRNLVYFDIVFIFKMGWDYFNRINYSTQSMMEEDFL